MNKFWKFISKDSFKENESTKLIAVIRLILIVMFVYSIVVFAMCIPFFDIKGDGIMIGSTLVYAAMFGITYKLSRRTTLVVVNVVGLFLVYIFIVMFGWDVGVQQFLTVILVAEFFAAYKAYLIKIAYAVSLLGIRIVFYMYSIMHSPMSPELAGVETGMQIASSVAAFICIGIICFVYGIDSQKVEGKLVEYNIRLANEAHTDALTGLPNRRGAIEYLQRVMNPTNTDTGLSVAMLDIDFFKKVNDNYGHDVGDAVLKGIAGTLREMMDDVSYASRWGGEEFLLVFKCNGDDAYVKLDYLMLQIRNLQFRVIDRTFGITVTIGLEEYNFESDYATLIKGADEKLYQGKESGRNQIVF